jgi:hypothetical protein
MKIVDRVDFALAHQSSRWSATLAPSNHNVRGRGSLDRNCEPLRRFRCLAQPPSGKLTH